MINLHTPNARINLHFLDYSLLINHYRALNILIIVFPCLTLIWLTLIYTALIPIIMCTNFY